MEQELPTEKQFEEWISELNHATPKNKGFKIMATGWRDARDVLDNDDSGYCYITNMISLMLSQDDEKLSIVKSAVDKGMEFSLRIDSGKVVSSIKLK